MTLCVLSSTQRISCEKNNSSSSSSDTIQENQSYQTQVDANKSIQDKIRDDKSTSEKDEEDSSQRLTAGDQQMTDDFDIIFTSANRHSATSKKDADGCPFSSSEELCKVEGDPALCPASQLCEHDSQDRNLKITDGKTALAANTSCSSTSHGVCRESARIQPVSSQTHTLLAESERRDRTRDVSAMAAAVSDLKNSKF